MVDRLISKRVRYLERPTPPTPLRVLLVDDYPDSVEFVAEVLKSFECEVRIAVTGLSAVEQVRTYHPALVLLDIGLPDIDGFDVARLMRRQPELEASWLVALTGFHDPRLRVIAKEAGFDEYLVKPLDALSVETLVRDLAMPQRASGY